MYSSIANTTFGYVLTQDKFRNNFDTPIKPSYIKITTITLVAKYSNPIDIKYIKSKFEESEVILISNDSYSYKWSKKNTNFFNQITLSFNDNVSTKSIKLFPNGSVQIAGCFDLFDCKRVIMQLTELMKKITKVDNTLVNDFRIVMINSNFSTNFKLNLHKVVEHFSRYSLFEVSFDPDRYSAVKIKFKPANDMKRVTVSVFCTGKVIITGAENLKEITYTYNIINRYINSEPSIKVESANIIEVFDNMYGYNAQDLVAFLYNKGFRPWGYTPNNYKINF